MIKKGKAKTKVTRTKNTKVKKTVKNKNAVSAKTKKKPVRSMKKPTLNKTIFGIPKTQPGHIKEDLKWISESQGRSVKSVRQNKGYHKMPKSHTGTRHH